MYRCMGPGVVRQQGPRRAHMSMVDTYKPDYEHSSAEELAARTPATRLCTRARVRHCPAPAAPAREQFMQTHRAQSAVSQRVGCCHERRRNRQIMDYGTEHTWQPKGHGTYELHMAAAFQPMSSQPV